MNNPQVNTSSAKFYADARIKDFLFNNEIWVKPDRKKPGSVGSCRCENSSIRILDLPSPSIDLRKEQS
jgi:hypothetical protein